MSRKERAEQFWEPLAVFAALASIPALLLDPQMKPDQALLVNIVIWSVFLLEYCCVLAVCRDGAERLEWTKQAWTDVVIIVGTFPFLPPPFQSLRILRLLKLARLLTLARLLNSLGKRFTLHPLLLTGSVAAIVVVIGGTALAVVEPETVRDLGSAMWWALTTVTTVGYGDIVPETSAGRLVGSLVMLMGSAVTAAFSAALAAFLIRRPEAEEMAALRTEIAELRQLLVQRSPQPEPRPQREAGS